MPDAAPRLSAGALFMIPAMFGAANKPIPMPLRSSSAPNAGNQKLAGSVINSPKLRAATSMPPVVKGRADDEVAHQHPEQVADVLGAERVEVDAAEDGGQRDQDDRGVERGHEHAQRRVRQHDPPVRSVHGRRSRSDLYVNVKFSGGGKAISSRANERWAAGGPSAAGAVGRP